MYRPLVAQSIAHCLNVATDARNLLAHTNFPVVGMAGAELVRMLDSVAENAANARATVEGLTPAKKAQLLRRVRKALGYTCP